jgi:hypothetical protein
MNNRLLLETLRSLLGFLSAFAAAFSVVLVFVWTLDRSSVAEATGELVTALALLMFALGASAARRVLAAVVSRMPTGEMLDS